MVFIDTWYYAIFSIFQHLHEILKDIWKFAHYAHKKINFISYIGFNPSQKKFITIEVEETEENNK